MTVFEPGTFTSVLTASLDAAAGAAPQWRGDVLQLSPGRLEWSTDAFHTRRLQLAASVWSLGVDLNLAPPRGSVVLALSMPSRKPVTLARRPASSSDILALAPGEALQLRSFGAGGMLTLAIDQETLEQGAASAGACGVLERRSEARLQLREPGQGDNLFHQLASLLRILRSRPAQIGDPCFMAQVEGAILHAVVSGVERPAERRFLAGRHHLAQRAEELLRGHIEEPILLRQLCGQLSANASSLHQGFLECFGMAPKAYLRNLRLNGARRQLAGALEPTSVTEVALDWGFQHFSRFAQDYSKLFGETPSATLRRNRPGGQSSARLPGGSAALLLDALCLQDAIRAVSALAAGDELFAAPQTPASAKRPAIPGQIGLCG